MSPRQNAAPDDKKPYADKLQGCKAYLALSHSDRLRLVKGITLKPAHPNAKDIEAHVARSLGTVPPKLRAVVVDRLLAWFDRLVVKSLLKQHPTELRKSEVQQFIASTIQECRDDTLIDDFGTLTPPAKWMLPKTASRQIELVKGSDAQFSRATRECWRALAQRGKWLDGDLSSKVELEKYDTHLVETWRDHRERRAEQSAERDTETPYTESDKAREGRETLDWSHFQASNFAQPIRPFWRGHYLVRGSYQLLANDLRVGWHPEYLEKLDEGND